MLPLLVAPLLKGYTRELYWTPGLVLRVRLVESSDGGDGVGSRLERQSGLFLETWSWSRGYSSLIGTWLTRKDVRPRCEDPPVSRLVGTGSRDCSTGKWRVLCCTGSILGRGSRLPWSDGRTKRDVGDSRENFSLPFDCLFGERVCENHSKVLSTYWKDLSLNRYISLRIFCTRRKPGR